MLSGIKSSFDIRHLKRLQRENSQHKSTSTIITVPTQRLETILDTHSVHHVHYLSIDVEGAEFDVIQSIDFGKVFIDVIGFENNYADVSEPIVNYLLGKNYRVLHKGTDIFMIHNQSTFNTKRST